MNSTEVFYERLNRPMNDLSLPRRRQDVLFDKKWKIFLRQARLFCFLPFIDAVFAAGSMALGNVHETSDFDVIVLCRYGRIFTARAFCILTFELLGKRREKLTHKEEASDMVCLNHFVTEKSSCLAEPHNLYWQELYKNLVPLYGEDKTIRDFFKTNDWMGERTYIGDIRHKNPRSRLKIFLEYILSGLIGNKLEAFLKKLQVRRIKNNLEKDVHGFEPRLRVSDEELEFHPDTKRIRELVRLD
ncbi:MAG TPA: hypothetical protein VJK04_01055 [Candidatus Paceibacterota bacterium]